MEKAQTYNLCLLVCLEEMRYEHVGVRNVVIILERGCESSLQPRALFIFPTLRCFVDKLYKEREISTSFSLSDSISMHTSSVEA